MVSRAKLVENSRTKFYENLSLVYKENKDAKELPASVPAKKKITPTVSGARAASGQRQSSSNGTMRPKSKPTGAGTFGSSGRDGKVALAQSKRAGSLSKTQ